MNKNIILTGSDGGFNNLGDEFILDAVISKYLSMPKISKIFLLSTKPLNRYSDDRVVNLLESDKDSIKKLDLRSIDIIHYYGGGYLNYFWYDEKFWLYHHAMSKGFPKDKVVFTGQGLGPFKNSQLADIKKVAKNSSIFSCRDSISLSYIYPYGFNDFDDTISLMPRYKPKARSRLCWNL